MKRSTLFIITSLVVTLTALSFWPARAADEAAPALAPGVVCKVYVRGDAAGQAVQSYVGVIGNNANISGTLRAINNDWVVVTQEKREYHIPRGVVLAIEVNR